MTPAGMTAVKGQRFMKTVTITISSAQNRRKFKHRCTSPESIILPKIPIQKEECEKEMKKKDSTRIF